MGRRTLSTEAMPHTVAAEEAVVHTVVVQARAKDLHNLSTVATQRTAVVVEVENHSYCTNRNVWPSVAEHSQRKPSKATSSGRPEQDRAGHRNLADPQGR